MNLISNKYMTMILIQNTLTFKKKSSKEIVAKISKYRFLNYHLCLTLNICFEILEFIFSKYKNKPTSFYIFTL